MIIIIIIIIIIILHNIQTGLGANLLFIQWLLGDVSAGVKRQQHEADHSPPSSADVKNDGAMPPLLHTPS
jgi:hypothetical protein